MKISVQLEFVDRLEFLRFFSQPSAEVQTVGEQVSVSVPVQPIPAEAPKARTRKASAPAPEAPAAPAPVAPAPAKDAPITFEAVKVAIEAYGQAKGIEKARELLKSFSVKRISELKPEQYVFVLGHITERSK